MGCGFSQPVLAPPKFGDHGRAPTPEEVNIAPADQDSELEHGNVSEDIKEALSQQSILVNEFQNRQDVSLESIIMALKSISMARKKDKVIFVYRTTTNLHRPEQHQYHAKSKRMLHCGGNCNLYQIILPLNAILKGEELMCRECEKVGFNYASRGLGDRAAAITRWERHERMCTSSLPPKKKTLGALQVESRAESKSSGDN
jgi:hypothetical protein